MIRLYWFGGHRNEINFGDSISPAVVEMMSGRPVRYAGIDTCDMAAIGSILPKIIRKKYRRFFKCRFDPIRIWGSGALGPLSKASGLDIVGVRGKMTAETLGLPEAAAVGDPGLLIDRFGTKARKKFRWGITPHVADRGVPEIRALANEPKATLIDLGNPDLMETIRNIQSCDFIASTSLHGLIAADAFGIPNVWLRVSENVGGGSWKFQDYFSMVGRMEREPLIPGASDLSYLESCAVTADKCLVDKCRQSLESSFRKIF